MAKKETTKTLKEVKKAKTASAKSSSSSKAKPKKSVKTKPAPVKAAKKTAAAATKSAGASSGKERKVKLTKKQKNPGSPREAKIQEIKLKLLQQRSALLNEAETALNELPGQTIFPDLGDQATAETDRNFMLRLRGREQRLLKKIDEAVDRIDKGTFGICDDCGNEIDVKRLEARPVTTMCIECKTLQEEEEKLRAS